MDHIAKVVVIVFDGLRPDMVTPSRMPHLHAFAGQSRWFTEARSVFPSMTRVATASIATGAPPAAHGVVGNSFYFPTAIREHVLDTSQVADLARAEVALGTGLLTAPTFADRLSTAGKSMAVVHSGSAGSAYVINPGVVANRHWTFSVLGAGHTRTPAAVEEVVQRLGPLPPRELPRFAECEYVTRVFTEHVLADMDPDVALLWLNEPDTSFHYKMLDSYETRAVIGAVDAAFGRIRAAIDRRPDADEIAVIVASDHGQISSSGIVDLSGLLSQAGHNAVDAGKRDLRGAQVVLTGGNMGEIRILDGDLDRRDAIARWLMQRDEIGMIFTPSEDPVRGSVEGTFSLSLVGLDQERAPELVYVLRSGREPDAHGLPGLGLITGGVPLGGGMHGGLNRHELNTVLILGGDAAAGGVVHDEIVGIVDLGPTILGMLGVEAGPTMVGGNLAAIPDSRPRPEILSFEATAGSFGQRLTVARRGRHTFPVHGGRVG